MWRISPLARCNTGCKGTIHSLPWNLIHCKRSTSIRDALQHTSLWRENNAIWLDKEADPGRDQIRTLAKRIGMCRTQMWAASAIMHEMKSCALQHRTNATVQYTPPKAPRRRRVSGEKLARLGIFAGLLCAESVRCVAHAYCPARPQSRFSGWGDIRLDFSKIFAFPTAETPESCI